MTYVFETKIGGKDVVVEYTLSSVTNLLKIVDMTADGKFHRFNWMNEVGQKKLMSQLMKDYDRVMLGQQDSDYDSEMDLDRDVPEFAYGV